MAGKQMIWRGILPLCEKRFFHSPLSRRYLFRPGRVYDDFFNAIKVEKNVGNLADSFLRSFVPRYTRVPWFSESDMYKETIRHEDGSKTLQLMFDVRNYEPDNIKVSSVDNSISVKAKQEEKTADGGKWFREFHREMTLPEGLDLKEMKSHLSDGVLTIEAPYLAKDAKEEPREIPIERK